MKIGYPLHCKEKSSVATHCISCALFNPHDEDFQPEPWENHNNTCNDCFELINTLENISSAVSDLENSQLRDELLYDVSTAVKAILDWMHHILRSVKQHEAKKYAFSQLDENTRLWLSDWAQKVIPVLFREGQREYFGKRGMSLHIDLLFRKVDNILSKNVYHTAISKCDQDSRDTLCISSHVIKQMKSDFPELKCLFRKSDNAGCYSANSLAELTRKICKENEIQLLRYDYNEP